ncbi:MAG: YncE family protein [Gemmatimonadales bacterium]
MSRGALCAALWSLAPLALPAQATPVSATYFALVIGRPIDQVTLIRFGPKGAAVVHRTSVHIEPDRSADPQAIALAPNGREYLITTANGIAGGELLRIAIAADSSPYGQPSDTVTGREPLGGMPGAVRVAPDGKYAWVNVVTGAGSPGPGARGPAGALVVVYLPRMIEVARIRTCGGARGAALGRDGTTIYTVCSHGDSLLEVDTGRAVVSRRLALPATADGRPCGATAVIVDATGHLDIACSGASEVLIVDAQTWTVASRIAIGGGVGGIAVTKDGRRLVALNPRTTTVSIVDLATRRITARVLTRRVIADDIRVVAPLMPAPFVTLAMLATGSDPVGVALTPDSRFAFVAAQAGGSSSSTVQVIDLATGKVVTTLTIGLGAGPVEFWKMK